MQMTHIDAEARYAQLRLTALKAAQAQTPSNLGLSFRLFDDDAFAASKAWSAFSERRVNWDWLYSYPAFKFRHPKRFELALWHQNNLASLSLGRPTRNAAGLRLDFLEGSPENRNLKVVPFVLLAMAVYAESLGATEIRLVQPINDTVRKYYEGFGMQYVRKGDFLFMRLG
ncbi:hypothetical protein V8J88_01540 [Massilia sp. W12]|uniref:hypothetical protein n=1 Tax=Massilia sp. W12 TaxID=3126507 RepID=UPI0030D13815